MALGGAHLWPSVGPEPVPMIAGRYRPERLAPPVPFLHGVEDGCIDPVLARPALRDAPGMTVESVPGVGHFVPEGAPGIVISRALAFLRLSRGPPRRSPAAAGGRRRLSISSRRRRTWRRCRS